MNDLARQEKVRRFLADREMSGYVKDVLLTTFLRKDDTDGVGELAAKMRAIHLLQDGFRDLEKIAAQERQEPADFKQPGL